MISLTVYVMSQTGQKHFKAIFRCTSLNLLDCHAKWPVEVLKRFFISSQIHTYNVTHTFILAYIFTHIYTSPVHWLQVRHVLFCLLCQSSLLKWNESHKLLCNWMCFYTISLLGTSGLLLIYFVLSFLWIFCGYYGLCMSLQLQAGVRVRGELESFLLVCLSSNEPTLSIDWSWLRSSSWFPRSRWAASTKRYFFLVGGLGGSSIRWQTVCCENRFILWCFVISFMRSPHLLMMYISFLLAICFTTVVRDCVLLPVFTWCCGQDGHWWDDRQTLINWAALYPGVKVILQGNCRLVAYRKLETNHWHSTYLPIWEHPLRTSTREGGGYHNGDTGEGQS